MVELQSSGTVIPGELFALALILPADVSPDEMELLCAYKASLDLDTMHMHEAMKQQNAPQFREAMQKEVDDQGHKSH